MKGRYRLWLLLLPLVLITVFILWDTLQQPGIRDVVGGFEEVAFVRNEQNKGGIVRIYAFTVSDTTHADYLACGNLLPHNEYGSTTTAYFFEKGKSAPNELQLDSPHFDTSRFHAIARYIRNEKGAATVMTTP